MNGPLLSLERLFAALLAALSLSLIYPQAAFPATGAAIGAVIGGLGVLTLLRWREEEWKGLRGHAAVATCLLMAWAIWWLVSWLFRSEVRVLGTGSLATTLQSACAFVAVLGLSHLMTGKRQARPIVAGWLLAMACLIALHALYQVMGPSWLAGTFAAKAAAISASPDLFAGPTRAGILHALQEGRASGVFGSPNIFAGFLAMVLPVALAVSVMPHSRIARAAGPPLALLFMIGILYSGSRGGLIGAFVGTLAFAMLWVPARGLIATGTVLAAVLVLGAASPPTNLERWTATSTIQQRLAYWEAGAQIWKEAPIAGHGPGGFELHYPRHRQPFANETRFAHNWVVQWACEVGVAGLGLFAGWIGVVLYSGFLDWRRARPRDPLMAGFLSALAVLIVHGLVEFTLNIREMMLCMSVIAAVTLCPGQGSGGARFKGMGVSCALAIVALFPASWWFVQFAPARAEVLRESSAYATPDEGLRLLSESLRWQPGDPATWESRGFLRLVADVPGAREDLEKALSLNPHSSRLHESLGRLLWSGGGRKEAMALQEKAISLHPSDPDRRITMAAYLLEDGQVDEALAMIESTSGLLWTRTEGQAARDELLARISGTQASRPDSSGVGSPPTE